MALAGYIIANSYWTEAIRLEMGMKSFATTPAEAWRRHIGHHVSKLDFSTHVQRWHDRGHRPYRVEVTFKESAL